MRLTPDINEARVQRSKATAHKWREEEYASGLSALSLGDSLVCLADELAAVTADRDKWIRLYRKQAVNHERELLEVRAKLGDEDAALELMRMDNADHRDDAARQAEDR